MVACSCSDPPPLLSDGRQSRRRFAGVGNRGGLRKTDCGVDDVAACGEADCVADAAACGMGCGDVALARTFRLCPVQQGVPFSRACRSDGSELQRAAAMEILRLCGVLSARVHFRSH